MVLAATGGVYVYANINSPMFDRFFSEAKQKKREIKRLRNNFPDSVGEYILYERNPEKIRVISECGKVEDYHDSISLGISGEVCSRVLVAQYRDVLSNKVVFIHLTNIAKGKNTFDAFYEKFSRPDVLNGYKVSRVERHEIGWRPLQNFDMVLTQEGQWEAGEDGSENFSYKETATGNNSVTQYFLTTFPAELSN